MTYYAALDVSLRSVNVCIVNDAREVKFEAKVISEVEDIVTCLRAFEGEVGQASPPIK